MNFHPTEIFLSIMLVAWPSVAAPSGSLCPQFAHNSTVHMVGQWCAAQQILVAPGGQAIGEMDYVFIRNKKKDIVGGNWYLRTYVDGNTEGELISHTLQSNASNGSQIIESVLDCRNETFVNIEIDNAAGITFDNKVATIFWVYNASTTPRQYYFKLLASQSSIVAANEIIVFACPQNSTTKTDCGGSTTQHHNLESVAYMTTPLLNIVSQQWTIEFNASSTSSNSEIMTLPLAAQIVGLATSPQSLSWCASSIAAIVLIPLIIAMVACCCCHRRGCCRAKGTPSHVTKMSDETESMQYEAMFAVTTQNNAPKSQHIRGTITDGLDYATVLMTEQIPIAESTSNRFDS